MLIDCGENKYKLIINLNKTLTNQFSIHLLKSKIALRSNI